MNQFDQKWTRRRFMTTAAALPGVAALSRLSQAAQIVPPQPEGWSFVLLGDLHFDRPEHHDMEWLAREKPNDVRQVENYCRVTREIHPPLFAEVRDVVADLKKGATPPAFVLQIGDLVEGLCGTPALARRQSEEALDFVRAANLGAPFLFIKGNHDITGPGAQEAFDQILLPFTLEQARQTAHQGANYALEHGGAHFSFFDAYDKSNLAWLETTLAGQKSGLKFVAIHPPVVPYNARSNWSIYAKPGEAAERARLLEVLGRHGAMVLTGHLHKNSALSRRTPGGILAQLAVISIFNKPDVKPKTQLSGLEEYGPDLVTKTEPQFSPANEAERRAILAAEKPFIQAFDYADAPGYAVVTVRGASVQADLFSGLGRRKWKTIDLSALATGRNLTA